MWDDIIIGEGQSRCSAVKVFKLEGDHSISEHDFAYWISGREIFLNMGMTIYKSSPEGKVLTDMIEAKATVSQVYEWLDSLILTHADPIKLKVKIKQALRDAYAKGKRDKVREIRVALDLEARLTTVLPQGDFHGKEF